MFFTLLEDFSQADWLNDLSSTLPVAVTIAALVFTSEEDEAALREELITTCKVQMLLLQLEICQGLAIVSVHIEPPDNKMQLSVHELIGHKDPCHQRVHRLQAQKEYGR